MAGHAHRSKPSRYDFATRGLRFGVDDACHGRLYTPDRPDDAPVVVLAPGAGLAWRPTLEATAERYAERGYAVLAFDHRGFGASGDGRLVDPERQRVDFEAAIDAARDAPEVDGTRLGLWGLDLSAGTALAAAADSRAVDAVVARFPVARGAALLPDWIRPRLRGFAAGLLDYPVSAFDRVRGVSVDERGRRVPLFGDAGEVAAVSAPGVARAVHDALGREPGTTPARSLVKLQRHDLRESVEAVRCPSLFVAGAHDELVPAADVTALAESVSDASLVRVPTAHYAPLAGEPRERVLGHELAFLDTEL